MRFRTIEQRLQGHYWLQCDTAQGRCATNFCLTSKVKKTCADELHAVQLLRCMAWPCTNAEVLTLCLLWLLCSSTAYLSTDDMQLLH